MNDHEMKNVFQGKGEVGGQANGKDTSNGQLPWAS